MEQISSWGVESVWGDYNYYNTGEIASDKYAFVIDSGISLDTKDLNVHTKWAKSFIDGEAATKDTNGHGTAVASVIGAKADEYGLTGVAPGAQVIPIKVFGSSGTTSNKIVNDALDYVYNVILENNLQDTAVVNLSLGTKRPDAHPLLEKFHEAGIKVAVAAGNSMMDVDEYSPACYGHLSNIYTVSATKSDGGYATFTNFDSGDDVDDVDFAAPGQRIPVYSPTGELRYVNGTSFSAPHVAGLLLMGGIKAGPTQRLSQFQRENGMNKDPLALHDPVTAKRNRIKGDRGDNVLSGTSVNDKIRGLKGDDIISGNLGNDILRGGKGDDTLDGGIGSDILTGGFGANTYKSQEDSHADTIIFKSDGKVDTIEKLDEFDRIVVVNQQWQSITVQTIDASKIGIYADDELEAVYTGKNFTAEQLEYMVIGT